MLVEIVQGDGATVGAEQLIAKIDTAAVAGAAAPVAAAAPAAAAAAHHWPGNVRELDNWVERLCACHEYLTALWCAVVLLRRT